MIPSLSEVNATGRKAARGVGMGWGHADEAGCAASWLWQHGLDGVGALAHLLEAHETAPLTDRCPLHLGTGICDAPPDGPVRLARVVSPILLLSFAAELAKITDGPVTLRFDGQQFGATPEGMFSAVEGASGGLVRQADVVLGPGPVQGDRLMPVARRPVDTAAWARLERLAHHTYAPATEASRLAGAGAGLSDND